MKNNGSEELIKEDSLEDSCHTPMYNPHILPLSPYTIKFIVQMTTGRITRVFPKTLDLVYFESWEGFDTLQNWCIMLTLNTLTNDHIGFITGLGLKPLNYR